MDISRRDLRSGHCLDSTCWYEGQGFGHCYDKVDGSCIMVHAKRPAQVPVDYEVARRLLREYGRIALPDDPVYDTEPVDWGQIPDFLRLYCELTGFYSPEDATSEQR